MLVIPQNLKENYLVYVLKTLLKQPPKAEEGGKKNKKKKRDKPLIEEQAIVFTQSCEQTHFLFLFLKHLEVSVTLIHSLIPQQKRMANLERFKSGRIQVLVATDVASRGLDI